MGIHDLWLFMLAGVLLNITPGPDMALIIARSTRHGTRAGVAAALGVGVGAFLHIAAAAIGISALLLASALAFTILKWAGALYLIYLGIQMLRSSFAEHGASDGSLAPAPSALRRVFLQGVLTNATNPKVAMFFLAFLPQFVDPDAPSKAVAFITLGLVFDSVGTAWNVAVACLAGTCATSGAYGRVKPWLERTIGALFIGLGVKLAFAEAS
jgi:RhtB (resistance to homoserine/threonine) family protein